MMKFDEIEQEIDQKVEDDLVYEKRELKNKRDIFRHKVETFTRSKPVLLAVVTLNVIDCILVSLELLFDFLYFTGGLENPSDVSTVNGTTCFPESGSFKIFGDLSHHFHHASIAILSFLLMIMIAHVFGSGKRFFRYKLHTCDSIVIIAVFILDVGLYNGIPSFNRGTAIWILMVMLMLRVLRLVNSLVVILVDGQRLQIRVMYTTKKKLTAELEESKSRGRECEEQLKSLKTFFLSKGLDEDALERVMHGDTPQMYINFDANDKAQKGQRLQENCHNMTEPLSRGNMISRTFRKLHNVVYRWKRPNNGDLHSITSNSPRPSYDKTIFSFNFDESRSDHTISMPIESLPSAANTEYENRAYVPISRTSLHEIVFETTIEVGAKEVGCIHSPAIYSKTYNSTDIPCIESPQGCIGNKENDIYDTML